MKTANGPGRCGFIGVGSMVVRSLMKPSRFSCRTSTVLSTMIEGIAFPLWLT